MAYRITPDERARFKRCRRQWDFASEHRRDLQPVGRVGPPLTAALREALAVYYYPGTWDWPHQLTQSLVHKALDRSLSEAGAPPEVAAFGGALLDCYDAWAATVDDFAPVKINHEVRALVPDPAEAERGLMVRGGSGVVYECEIDLVAADAGDEYWVVRHQIVDEWQDMAALISDEEAIAACWTWEQDFIGVTIAGTIHNEVRVTGELKFPSERAARAVAQHEASGGGRSIPQHERVVAQAARTAGERVEQREAGVLRRTRIRRTRDEVGAVPAQLAAQVRVMAGLPRIEPAFGEHCAVCEFSAPCLAILVGEDPEPLLANGFQLRPVDAKPKPKLGQSTWGFGRGAAPPEW